MPSNICPVCDEQFDSGELFHKHVDEHLNEPTINDLVKKVPIENTGTELFDEKTSPRIDLKEIFSEEKFEKLVQLKMEEVLDDREKLKKQNFIEQIKKINQRNPFLYMPYFIKDFMNGISANDIECKYHIWHFMDHRNITHNILGFKENRYLSKKYNNAFELNLKNIYWKNKYQELEDNCRFFKNELEELIFKNVLQAGIIFLLMDKQLDKDTILHEIRGLKDHYDLYHFVDDGLANRFNELLKVNLEKRIDDILFSLKKEDVIKRDTIGSRKLITTFSIDKIKKSIIKELKFEGQLRHSVLKNSIIGQFPGLRLIPKFGVFETAWHELNDEKIIHIEYESSRRNDIVFFLHENFQKIDDSVKSINSANQIVPFKGRKISPEKFIDELLELDKGDFNDADDQVTRLAGLVLAESIKIQSPHEKIKEFDFTIDLKNYKFRPEQLNAISKLNFKINSEIMHVKVMINEVLNLKKYNELREKLPDNEQGVVITFQKIPLVVKKMLENDSTLQIVDKEGVKIWVSITTRIPARVNSISKIYVDPLSKLENKIVRVESVFYETGIALVSIIPEMKEVTVLARSLEEILFNEDSLISHNVLSKNYFSFLKTLSIVAPDTFEDGLNIPIKSIEKKLVQNSQNGRMELIHDAWIVEYDDVKVEVDLNQSKAHSIFKCSCYHMVNQEHSYTMCKHIVSSLNHITIQKFLMDGWNSKTRNLIERAMISFLEMSVRSTAQKIAVDLDEKQLLIFKNYLQNYADLIESQ